MIDWQYYPKSDSLPNHLAKRGILSGEGDYEVDKKPPDFVEQIPRSEDKPV